MESSPLTILASLQGNWYQTLLTKLSFELDKLIYIPTEFFFFLIEICDFVI